MITVSTRPHVCIKSAFELLDMVFKPLSASGSSIYLSFSSISLLVRERERIFFSLYFDAAADSMNTFANVKNYLKCMLFRLRLLQSFNRSSESTSFQIMLREMSLFASLLSISLSSLLISNSFSCTCQIFKF